MSTAPKGSKLSKFVNHRVKVVVSKDKYILGKMLGFDTHLNMVIEDAEEYRVLRKRKAGEQREQKRVLGVIILRGDQVTDVEIEGPPPPSGNRLSSSSILSVQTSVEKVDMKKPIQGLGAPSVEKI